MLSKWAERGESGPLAAERSGIVALPLLVTLQIAQYFQYLENNGLRHSTFLARLKDAGGVNGFCVGLPSAIAIACSKDEEEVVKNASIAMRVVLGVALYAELGDYATMPGSTTLALRLKREGQGVEIVSRFPGVSVP